VQGFQLGPAATNCSPLRGVDKTRILMNANRDRFRGWHFALLCVVPEWDKAIAFGIVACNAPYRDVVRRDLQARKLAFDTIIGDGRQGDLASLIPSRSISFAFISTTRRPL